MNIIVKNIKAQASIGNNHHGIILQIEGTKQLNYYFNHTDKISIDIQGPIFSSLPSGMGTLANLFLPYKIEQFSKDQFKQNQQMANFSIALGQNQLSEETLIKTLDSVIKNGDPYFYVELIHNCQNTLCVFPTKCSLIKKSLQGSEKANIVYQGKDIPEFKIKNNIFGYLRWLLLATLYMAALWMAVLQFEKVDKLIPVRYFSKEKLNNKLSYIDYLPPFPKNKTEAYIYGVYNEQYQQMETLNNHEGMKKILEDAANLAQRKTISAEELKGIKQNIWELEQNKGFVQRIIGFFTFVNVIWIISILGISITVGPALYFLLKPLREFFGTLLIKIFKKVILPTIEFLHNFGVFELCAYVLCFFFVIEGLRLNPEYGFYISLTGMALQIPSFLYSTMIHQKKIRSPIAEEIVYEILNYWALICWLPFYNSTLLGYITVILFYSLMGFRYHCFWLCHYIGFENNDSLIRIVICSFFALTIYTILKIISFPDHYLSPFASAISVLGSFTLFLGLLINSSLWDRRGRYGIRQLMMICTLVCSLFFGYLLGIEGMRNTGIVFSILYVLEKCTETHFENRWNPWIYFFVLSILLWRSALYLHTNPQYIVSLFKLFG